MAIKMTVQVGRGGPKATINYGGAEAELTKEDGTIEKLTTEITVDGNPVILHGNYASPGDAITAALKAMVGLS